MAIVERYFWNKVFICSMKYWVCFWCSKTRREVMLIETKLSYEKLRRLRWQRVSLDV